MQRPPPSSPVATLPSAFFSFLAHAAVVVGGLIMIPATPPPVAAAESIIVPVDLVTLSDTTNLMDIPPPTDTPSKEEEAIEEPEVAPAAAPPPAPPPEDTVSFEKPKEPPKPKKAEPEPTLSSDIDALMKAAEDFKKNNQKANPAPAPANTPPQLGAGDKRRMTARIEDIIKTQLTEKGCFADHSDMADARRMRGTFRVWFGRNGKFSQKYQLISPTREPFGDPPLQAFITHARRALDMCNNIGWQIPEEYFTQLGAPYIDLEFTTQLGASR